MSAAKFIADVHLGRLARMLRMLGFDVLYRNDYSHEQLRRLANGESRVLLTRNKSFAMEPGSSVCVIKDTDSEIQLAQVVGQFELQNSIEPFTRCLLCNGVLEPVEKQKVQHKLLPETIRFFDEFWKCDECDQVVWKGSHFERMVQRMKRIGL